jgi:hypothetical protein
VPVRPVHHRRDAQSVRQVIQSVDLFDAAAKSSLLTGGS